MARVFLWRPHGDNVGHLSMELNKDRTYISCWPKGDSKLKTLFGTELTTQTLEQDKRSEKRDYDDYIDIPGNFIDHDKVVNWWVNKRPKEYSLLKYNCTLCVYDAVQAGAVKRFWRNSMLNVFSPANFRFVDDDDPSPEQYRDMRDNPIEEDPLVPERVFKLIKIWAEGGINNQKCTIC